MHLVSIIALLFLTATHAAVNGPCTGSPGVCVTTANCARDGGTSVPGYCPNDPDNVRCCTKYNCGASRDCGYCEWTNACTGGGWQVGPGECPGPAGFRCCLPREGLC
ncbi:hypothetical protein DFP73DRAFT_514075 [Morchella snyderi]|nr:hypothetical protein DFP73DRAFT_514075 [Morchella snyderi]